jgi:predicted nucleic acid-binding protein
MKVVLDTSVLLGPDPGPIDADVAISSMSLAELHFSVLIAKDAPTRAERLRRLSVVERTFDPIPIDEAVARQYGRLAAAVVSVGRQPRARVADLLIAATAVANDASLWTRNADDLTGLETLVDIRAFTN